MLNKEKKYIVRGTYYAQYDDGYTVVFPCMVNMKTKEVFLVEQDDSALEHVQVEQGFFVRLEKFGTLYPLDTRSEEEEPSDTKFWFRNAGDRPGKAFTLRFACFEPDGEMHFEHHTQGYPSYEEALNTAYRAAINEYQDLNNDAADGSYFDIELDTEEYLDESLGYADAAVCWYDKPQNDRCDSLQYKPVTCYQVIEVEDTEIYSQALSVKYEGKHVPRLITTFEPKTGETFYTADLSDAVFHSHKHAIDAYEEADDYCKRKFVTDNGAKPTVMYYCRNCESSFTEDEGKKSNPLGHEITCPICGTCRPEEDAQKIIEKYHEANLPVTGYICKHCGEIFEREADEDFSDYEEENLWGHLQMKHEDLFEEDQDLETPDMLELHYDKYSSTCEKEK